MSLYKSMSHLPKTQTPVPLLKPWLDYRQSLTEKLRILVGDANIQVLNQAWVDTSSLKPLAQAEQHPGLMLKREILCMALKTSCWYAQTLIPESSYQNYLEIFQRLKHETLGQIIFSEPRIKRQSLETYPISPGSHEYPWISRFLREKSEPLWVRSSLFLIDDESAFYLLEVFLPGFLQLLAENTKLDKNP